MSDQEIKNDDVIYMVFAKETGAGWEELQVETFTPYGDRERSEESLGMAP